ncbi:MAG: hypothetical protein CMH25_02360 [Micavibrio sp.]|nr:hypothetical protein [Micavibrio sp.]|tara:strand:- start:459582 stop:460568 length:987 start_codon:yes stop_codon:yes gene_type:complete
MSFLNTIQSKPLHQLHLNRPEALNALNMSMIEGISAAINAMHADENAFGLVITGEGRAFCAGGDIKAARTLGSRDPKLADAYFKLEYEMNRSLFGSDKCTVAIMDGVTMGGGVGVANACQYRICTDNTKWAMPETAIGFFPDVGGAYYLAQMGEGLDLYFGLTGAVIANPSHLITYNLATHYVPADKIEDFKVVLSEAKNEDDVKTCLDRFSTTPEGSNITDTIDIEMLKVLKNNDLEGAIKKSKLLQSKSPTSLMLAYRHIMMASDEGFEAVSHRDLKLAKYCMRHSDFFEGVRALLIDKDKNPQWIPDKIEDLDMSKINALFTKTI